MLQYFSLFHEREIIYFIYLKHVMGQIEFFVYRDVYVRKWSDELSESKRENYTNNTIFKVICLEHLHFSCVSAC